MNMTAEEKLMYEVMQAAYDSGLPISFKGSMVLKACLMEAEYSGEIRHTVDIDANWNSDGQPTGNQMAEALQGAIDKSEIELDVSLYRMYGEKRSAGFELTDKTTGEMLFSMDIDVNRPVPPTKVYEVSGLRFRGVTSSQMIADKLSVISTDKVFRRIKDVVDIYYIAKVFNFDQAGIMQTLRNSNRALGSFHGLLHRTEDLKHAYEKFRFEGGVNKPSFEEVYRDVKAYINEAFRP